MVFVNSDQFTRHTQPWCVVRTSYLSTDRRLLSCWPSCVQLSKVNPVAIHMSPLKPCRDYSKLD